MGTRDGVPRFARDGPSDTFFENRLRGKIVGWKSLGCWTSSRGSKNGPGQVEKASAGWHHALELQKISSLLIQEGDIDALYARVLEAATDLTSADMASLQFHPFGANCDCWRIEASS